MPFDINVVRELVKSGKSAAQVSQIIGEPRTSVWRYVDKNNLGPWLFERTYDNRAVPDDFAKLGGTMTIKAAQRFWQCSNRTARRWYAETGIEPSTRRSNLIVIPKADLERVRGMRQVDAAELLGVSIGVVARAMKDIPRAARPKLQREYKPPKPRAPRTSAQCHSKALNTTAPSVARYQRDMSKIGQAVEFLQTLGPVSRCHENGKLDPKGTMWRRGNSLPLTDDEVIERAEINGWKPVGLGY